MNTLMNLMYRKLKIDVMRLHAMLVARATHRDDYGEEEFQELRDKIISQNDFRDYIPDFLFSCRTLDQFWNYVKSPKFTTYDERREFLQNEFNPLLSILEDKQFSKTQEKVFEYDVALSFAGEERPYVEKVAKFLKANHVKVFYDKDEEEEAKMWGVDLAEYLYEVYSKRARYCVMFISNNYVDKIWARHERRGALERAINERRKYILPARFDDTQISGLPSTFQYTDLRKKTPDELGKLVLMTLGVPVDKKLDIRVSVIDISIQWGIPGVLSSIKMKNFIEIKAKNYDKVPVFLKPPRIRIKNETGYFPITQDDMTSVSILGGNQKLEPGNSWEILINPARYGAEKIDKFDYVAFIDKLDREYKSSSEEMSEAIDKWKNLEKKLHS